MPIDISRLSEDELLDLNRRIIERLHLIRSAKSLTRLARFSVGMMVEFEPEPGRVLRGSIARLNRQTATVVTPTGPWRVSPTLLRRIETDAAPAEPSARVVSISRPPRRDGSA